MEYRDIMSEAVQEDFFKVEIIDTDKIVFCTEYRKYCQDNKCGQYGKNYSCPPDCGTPEDMVERVKKYKKALILQTRWQIDDFSKKDELDSAKSQHNLSMLRLIKKIKRQGYDGLMAGASCCMLCDRCQKINNGSCKYPDLAFSCLSAYCINVKMLAEECSMEYQYENGILYFFGAWFFNEI